MSNVNGNDIDDLFKRAADKYPLRTDSADWNKLAADLDKDRSLLLPPANMGGGDKRKRRRFFWLFLLLPLGGIGYYAVQSSKPSPATAQHGSSQTPAKAGGDQPVSSEKGSNPVNAASAETPSAEPGKNTPATASAKNTPATASTGNTPTIASGRKATPAESTGKTPATSPSGTIPSGTIPSGTIPSGIIPSGIIPSGIIPSGIIPSGIIPSGINPSGITPSGTTPSGITARETPATTGPPSGIAPPTGTASGKVKVKTAGTTGSSGAKTINRQLTKRPSTEGQITGKRRTKGPATRQPETADQGTIGQPADEAKTNDQRADKTASTHISDRDLSLSALKSSRARTTGDVALHVTVTARNNPIAAKDSSGAKKRISAKNKKESFLYAGLIVAPDLSTVKMQSVKGVGTTYGVLLGYQLNKRWAVETGAYLDHKKYYTDGEYFKQKTTNPNYTLLNVDGYCNMWEIPINVRYNLSLGPKTKWFATAGMSTYLMTRENYISKIETSGWTYDSPWDVKKPSQYWFSIVNLSVGFEQKLGKIGNLRLEPYLRIPLKGMGTGSLPIMSAGLNIGITRRIW